MNGNLATRARTGAPQHDTAGQPPQRQLRWVLRILHVDKASPSETEAGAPAIAPAIKEKIRGEITDAMLLAGISARMDAEEARERAHERRQKERIELEPDAWERFERAVSVAAKSPPQHRTKKKKSQKRSKPKKPG